MDLGPVEHIGQGRRQTIDFGHASHISPRLALIDNPSRQQAIPSPGEGRESTDNL